MKIDHAIMIAQSIARSDHRVGTTRFFENAKGKFSEWSVDDAMKDETLIRLLKERVGDQELVFTFTSSIDTNERMIYQYVVDEIEKLLEDDFVPKTSRNPSVALPPNHLLEGVKNNPGFMYNLEKAVDKMKERPESHQYLRCYTKQLVALENLKKPDFGLHYCETFEQLVEHLAQCQKAGIDYSPIILNHDEIKHCIYFDYKVQGGRPHLLMLDSVAVSRPENQNNDDSDENIMSDMAQFSQTLHELNIPVGFTACGTSVQKSQWGCNVFALNFAKQAYRDKTALDELHRAPINATPKMLDTLIPARFLKHDQSLNHLDVLLEYCDKAKTQPVNQTGQTLMDYANEHRYKFAHQKAAQQHSLWEKRLAYFEELRDALK